MSPFWKTSTPFSRCRALTSTALAQTELPLEAIGGKRLLRWFVDGEPLPPGPPRRPVYWQPDGVGFARLTAIDADGRSARNTVPLSP
jgi:membrane carboxypeptidase/penicillin-binding protein PbpC